MYRRKAAPLSAQTVFACRPAAARRRAIAPGGRDGERRISDDAKAIGWVQRLQLRAVARAGLRDEDARGCAGEVIESPSSHGRAFRKEDVR